MTACIVGWAHSKFGKHDGVDVETLIAKAASDAMADAGIGPQDVDEIYLGHFNGGFVHWPKEKTGKPNAIDLRTFRNKCSKSDRCLWLGQRFRTSSFPGAGLSRCSQAQSQTASSSSAQRELQPQ